MTAEPSIPEDRLTDLLEVVRMIPNVLLRCERTEDGRILFTLNEGGLAQEYDVTTEQIRDVPLEELFGGVADEAREEFERAFEGEPRTWIREMGGRWFKHELRPIRDDGDVDAVVGNVSEVTGIVETRKRSDRRRAILDATLDASEAGILVVDPDGETVAFNDRFAEMWDPSDEAAIRSVLDQLEDPDEFVEKIRHLYDHPDETSRDEIRLTDGRILDRYSAPVVGNDGTRYGRVWFFRDVTEIRRAHAEIRERERRFRDLFDHTTVGFYRTTPDGRILYANPALADMLGFEDVEEMLERDLEEWGYGPDESREAWKRRIEEEDRIEGYEAEWERRDGSTIHVRESARLVRDDDGSVRYYEGTVEDLTEIKRVQHQLERSNEELEAFAQVVSHDLKAPLRGLLRLVKWIEDDLDEVPPEVAEHVGLLRGRVDEMQDLIDGLLAYSRVRVDTDRIQEVDLEEVARSVLPAVAVPEGFTVEVEDLPTVRGDPVVWRQILQNLIVNAIGHHDRDDGTVKVSGRWEDGTAVLTVSDDGPGIPEDVQPRIFDMFRTGRADSEGTGVGLAIVEKVVESAGGSVEVDSAPDEGATFRVRWPRNAGEL